MAFYRGSSSAGGDDDDIPGVWPSSLGGPETVELHHYCLPVPPGFRLPHNWKIEKAGFATQGPNATEDELRSHSGGWHNIWGGHNFWRGKDYWEVSAVFAPRHRRSTAVEVPAATTPLPRHGHPQPPFPPSSAEAELPTEQVILCEDGNPDDTPGYHMALRALEAAAAAAAVRKAAEVAAVIEAAAAIAAEQAAKSPTSSIG